MYSGACGGGRISGRAEAKRPVHFRSTDKKVRSGCHELKFICIKFSSQHFDSIKWPTVLVRDVKGKPCNF